MSAKSLGIDADLHTYMVEHSTVLDDVANDLIAETRTALADRSGMQVAPEQAALLTLLTSMIGARRVVEVGTFTGLSALAMARGLAPGGQVLCCDISDEYTRIARRYWQRAGVADRITLRLAPAVDTLRDLPPEPHLDLAFIDADKPNYSRYWAELVPRMRSGGVLLVDNVLWRGKVLDPPGGDTNAQIMAAFNDEVRDDKRVELVVLPIGDGLTIARRK